MAVKPRVIEGFLDTNQKNPDLFGDAILIRDDDGIGFALELKDWRGEWVRITIERIAPPYPRIWSLD